MFAVVAQYVCSIGYKVVDVNLYIFKLYTLSAYKVFLKNFKVLNFMCTEIVLFLCSQDEYMDALNKLHLTVTKAYKVQS